MNLVSHFHLLGDPDTGVLRTPPTFIAFDVLQVGRHDIRSFPLTRRRSILEDAIPDSEMVLPIRRLDSDGIAGVADSAAPGLERLVAKDPESA